MDDYVQIIEIVALTTSGERKHVVRPHEGDQIENEEDGGFTIHYGEREVLVAGEKRKLPGRKVTLYRDKLVEVTRELRYEPRVRPSVAAMRDREKAEVERLAEKLGADTVKA